MNDNDIIKALECCINGEGCNDRCPYHKYQHEVHCIEQHGHDLLDLINRLQTEIGRLNHIRAELSKEIDKLRDMVAQNEGVLPRYEQLIKTEAIKEFAEKLKKSAFECDVSLGYGMSHCTEVVTIIEIDDLVKEMTEGEDGREP